MEEHRVAIVVSDCFSEMLIDLSRRMHVWVCGTPALDCIAKQIWEGNEGYDLDRGVTTFKVTKTESPEDMVLRILEDVEVHHGEYSHEPPLSIVEVYGTQITSRVRQEFENFGFARFEEIEGGFIAFREGDG